MGETQGFLYEESRRGVPGTTPGRSMVGAAAMRLDFYPSYRERLWTETEALLEPPASGTASKVHRS